MKDLVVFARLLVVFAFVLSVALNVKLSLDNRLLTELLIAADNGLDTEQEVSDLIEDLHKILRAKKWKFTFF